MSPGFAAGISSLLLIHILEHGLGGLMQEKRLVRPIKFPQSPENDGAFLRGQLAAVPIVTFQRDVAVEKWADLNLRLDASIVPAASVGARLLILAGILLAFALLALALLSLRPGGGEPTVS